MPTLGPPPKKSPLPAVIGVALAIGLAAGAGYWWMHREKPAPELSVEDQARAQAAAAIAEASGDNPQQAAAAALVADGGAAGALGTATPPSPAEVAAKAAAQAQDALRERGLKRLDTSIEGPLESAIVAQAGHEVGPALTQVVTRTLVWWVHVPNDLLRGDHLTVLYEVRPNEEPLVHAVRFESGKTGQTHKAFLFKPSSDTYPRFYEPDGQEVELRLADAPLDDYEQVTSRLRDGRRHKGVDFKCPEGTPIKATFDGVVTRKNWNFRGNGNSLEVRDSRGRRSALYLHLSEIGDAIRPGVRVHKGQVLGKTGNTGHSFAPHLHYQLMAGRSKAVDPFLDARTVRRHVPASDRAAFEAELRKLDTLLGSSTVAGN